VLDISWFEHSLKWLEVLALRTGYLGVFIVSLAGSAVPFLPLPYLFVVVILARILDPLVLGLAAGIGGAIGKITSYALGRMGYRFLGVDKRRKMDALNRIIGKYGAIGVFIFAITPLPDDIYYIPIGMTKYSFTRFLIASTAGKIILAIFVAYAGNLYQELLALLTNGGVESSIIAIAILTAVTVIMLRVDWELFATHLERGGVREVLENLSEILALRRSREAGGGEG